MNLAAVTIAMLALIGLPSLASAQTAVPPDDANRNAFIGLFAIKEICIERNRLKAPQIEANFAKQTERASPELKAWTTSKAFTTSVAQRKREQKKRMRDADGAALIEGFCENLVK